MRKGGAQSSSRRCQGRLRLRRGEKARGILGASGSAAGPEKGQKLREQELDGLLDGEFARLDVQFGFGHLGYGKGAAGRAETSRQRRQGGAGGAEDGGLLAG